MPRLREVPRDEATAEVVLSSYQRLFGDRDPVAEPGTASGTPGNWWTVFALVPDVLRHAVFGFRLYQSPARLLPPQLRELGQSRAGWRVPDAVTTALKADLSDEQILELTYITTLYVQHAIMSRALRLEYDDRDEPVTEIGAPQGFSARDIGLDIAGSA